MLPLFLLSVVMFGVLPKNLHWGNKEVCDRLNLLWQFSGWQKTKTLKSSLLPETNKNPSAEWV